MWENFEKKLMDISVAVHKNETKSRANIKIRASCILDNTNNLMKTTNDKLPSQMNSLRKLSTKVDKMLPQTEKFISMEMVSPWSVEVSIAEMVLPLRSTKKTFAIMPLQS